MKCGLLASVGHAAYIRVKTVVPMLKMQKLIKIYRNGVFFYLGDVHKDSGLILSLGTDFVREKVKKKGLCLHYFPIHLPRNRSKAKTGFTAP
jgi:hypothetical protein